MKVHGAVASHVMKVAAAGHRVTVRVASLVVDGLLAELASECKVTPLQQMYS